MVRSTPLYFLYSNATSRVILYYPVSALVTLFANILQNPTEPRAKSDIRLMNSLIDFLSKLRQEGHSVVKRMLRVCTELERIARVVTENARAEANSQRSKKRKARTDLEAPKQKPLPFQAPFSSSAFNQSAGRGSSKGPAFTQQQDMPSVMEDARDMFPTVSDCFSLSFIAKGTDGNNLEFRIGSQHLSTAAQPLRARLLSV
jgi:hypothetical protein